MRRYLSFAILFLSLCTSSALAQTTTDTPVTQTSAPAVTASLAQGRVRFAAPAQVAQLRVEVYAAHGERVFDSGAHAGNVLDWQPADVAQGLTDGQYLFVVTSKDLQGKARQRFVTVALAGGQVSLQPASAKTFTSAQTEALAASRSGASNRQRRRRDHPARR